MGSTTQVLAILVGLGLTLAFECGFPGLPANGTIRGSGILFYPGEKVEYKCMEGFSLFGDETRICHESGRWSGELPECKRNLALGKPSLQSSTLWSYEPNLAVDNDPESCSFTPRSPEQRWWQVHLGDAVRIQSVAVTISPGAYQHFTIFVIELLEGNKAMYKPCSKFEGQFEDKRAMFLCNSGDGHPGQFVYIRDDREEQEYFGLCEVEVFEYQNFTRCGDPEQPVSSIVNRTSDVTVEYSCIKGYKMLGERIRTCDHRGRWSGKAPLCQEVQCGHPRSVKDGFIEVSNFRGKYVFGSLATYHCNPGYILWGNASRLCTQNGDWSGHTPQCKPITCGQPPEVINARSTLVNGSTLWQSMARYECKPGFKAKGYPRLAGDNQTIAVTSMCTESGIWQHVELKCEFDPLAEGGYLEGWKTLNGDSKMSISMVVTIAVLATLGILAAVVILVFFAHRRISDQDAKNRKTSQTSTNQLIAETNDLDKGSGSDFPLHSNHRPDNNGMMYNTIDVRRPTNHNRHQNTQGCGSQPGHFDTFPRIHSAFNHANRENSAQLSTFRPKKIPLPRHPESYQEEQDFQQTSFANNDLRLPSGHNVINSSSTTSVSDCGQRSSGDGGSEVYDDDPYSTLKVRTDQELLEEEEVSEEDEESHYSLIRQPDGQADEVCKILKDDDAGYESLYHHQEALQRLQNNKQLRENSSEAVGIESNKVREQVYDTLRRVIDPAAYASSDAVMTSSSGSEGFCSTAPVNSIKGIRPKKLDLDPSYSSQSYQPDLSPPELPPPPANVNDLYAKVDPTKKKRNRDSGSSESNCTSPNGMMSPTRSLIEKFNTMGSSVPNGSPHKSVIHVHSNPITDHEQKQYATISGRNKNSRFVTLNKTDLV